MPSEPEERVRSTASRAAASAAASRFALAFSRDARLRDLRRRRGFWRPPGTGGAGLDAGRALLEAADGAAGEPATHAHVATEDGEASRSGSGDLAMVAVTDALRARFARLR